MIWKKDDTPNTDSFEKTLQNQEQRCKDNPFACDLKDVWEKIRQKSQELEHKCYPNTYVWIEKFKDDNY